MEIILIVLILVGAVVYTLSYAKKRFNEGEMCQRCGKKKSGR